MKYQDMWHLPLSKYDLDKQVQIFFFFLILEPEEQIFLLQKSISFVSHL